MDESFDEVAADAPVSGEWRTRPLITAAIGLAAGLIFHWIVGEDSNRALSALEMAELALLVVGGGLLVFTLERRLWWAALVFAILAGATAAAVLYWNGDSGSWGATEWWRAVSLVLALAIAAPLFQAARDAGTTRFPYPAVHDHAWTNVVLWAACWGFVGVCFLLLMLLGALFALIHIDFLQRLLREGWFVEALMGLSFGAAIGLFRERDLVVRLAQRVVSTVLSVLAPVLAVGLILFLIALPFTGLHALWDATKATTPILLGCVIGSLILANIVIGSEPEHEARNPLLRFGAMGLGLVVLPLAVLAAVATGLRIQQYGFTPARLWALTFVAIATVYGVAYLTNLAIGRLNWAARIRPGNLVMAFLVCGVALLLATPLLSFNLISADDQLARLESGRISPEQFDWAALQFAMGAPGRAAVQRLKASKSPAIAALAARAAKAETRWALADLQAGAKRVVQLNSRLRVLPAGAALPENLRTQIAASSLCQGDAGCTLVFLSQGKEAMLLSNGCYDPQARPKPPATGTFVEEVAYCGPEIQRYVKSDQEWSDPAAKPEPSAADLAKRQAGYRAGAIEIRTVPERQLFIGGIPVGDPF